eukprot:12619165-Ditylum_brightwellii.AAC.1
MQDVATAALAIHGNLDIVFEDLELLGRLKEDNAEKVALDGIGYLFVSYLREAGRKRSNQ